MRDLTDKERLEYNSHCRWLSSKKKEGAQLKWNNRDLKNIRFFDMDFSEAYISFCDFEGSEFVSSKFSKTNIFNSNFKGVRVMDCQMHSGRLNTIDFEDADICLSSFINCSFRKSTFHNARISETYLRDSDFMESDLKGAYLYRNTMRRVTGNGREIMTLVLDGLLVNYTSREIQIDDVLYPIHRWKEFLTSERLPTNISSMMQSWLSRNHEFLFGIIELKPGGG